MQRSSRPSRADLVCLVCPLRLAGYIIPPPLALEDGRALELSEGDSQLRHIDRAWVSTVHAFQGRTVDTVIAEMEANHPHVTMHKTLYVEISRARERAELVTDNRDALRERLEQATGERIAALEAFEPERERSAAPVKEAERDEVSVSERIVQERPQAVVEQEMFREVLGLEL